MRESLLPKHLGKYFLHLLRESVHHFFSMWSVRFPRCAEAQKWLLDGIFHSCKSIVQHRRFVLAYGLNKRYFLRGNINQFVMEKCGISKCDIGAHTAKGWHGMNGIA